MKRRVLVEISKGGPLYAMLRDDQPKSLMKLVFLGINASDAHDRRPPESVEKEKVLIRMDTDRLLDRWLTNRWLQWCSINKRDVRFNVWLTMQIHKGWNIIASEERIFVPNYVDPCVNNGDESVHPESDLAEDVIHDSIPVDIVTQKLPANPFMIETSDAIDSELDVAFKSDRASNERPRNDARALGVRPELANLRDMFNPQHSEDKHSKTVS